MRRLWKDATNDVAVIDHDGVEWLTVGQAAERYLLQASTIRKWISRGVLAGPDVKRYGRYVAVAAMAVATAEHDLRKRGPKMAAGVRRVAR